jgi:hypothetical protein
MKSMRERKHRGVPSGMVMAVIRDRTASPVFPVSVHPLPAVSARSIPQFRAALTPDGRGFL